MILLLQGRVDFQKLSYSCSILAFFHDGSVCLHRIVERCKPFCMDRLYDAQLVIYFDIFRLLATFSKTTKKKMLQTSEITRMVIVNDKKTLLYLTVRQEGFMNTEEFGHQEWDTGFQFSLKSQMFLIQNYCHRNPSCWSFTSRDFSIFEILLRLWRRTFSRCEGSEIS